MPCFYGISFKVYLVKYVYVLYGIMDKAYHCSLLFVLV